MRELAVRPVDLAPPLGEGEDGVALGRQQPVQRRPGPPVGELPARVTLAPAAHPVQVDPEGQGGPAGRPAGVDGDVEQVEQAGLDGGVHARGDRAGGQSQRAFPCCRCSATACSVTGVQARERDYELELAKAEVARLSEALKEMAVRLTLVEGKDGWA